MLRTPRTFGMTSYQMNPAVPSEYGVVYVTSFDCRVKIFLTLENQSVYMYVSFFMRINLLVNSASTQPTENILKLYHSDTLAVKSSLI